MSYKNLSIALALPAGTSVFLSSNGARCHQSTWHQNIWPAAWSCSWFNRPPLLYPTNGLSLDSELNKRISGMHSLYSGLLQTPFLSGIQLRKCSICCAPSCITSSIAGSIVPLCRLDNSEFHAVDSGFQLMNSGFLVSKTCISPSNY